MRDCGVPALQKAAIRLQPDRLPQAGPLRRHELQSDAGTAAYEAGSAAAESSQAAEHVSLASTAARQGLESRKESCSRTLDRQTRPPDRATEGTPSVQLLVLADRRPG